MVTPPTNGKSAFAGLYLGIALVLAVRVDRAAGELLQGLDERLGIREVAYLVFRIERVEVDVVGLADLTLCEDSELTQAFRIQYDDAVVPVIGHVQPGPVGRENDFVGAGKALTARGHLTQTELGAPPRRGEKQHGDSGEQSAR